MLRRRGRRALVVGLVGVGGKREDGVGWMRDGDLMLMRWLLML